MHKLGILAAATFLAVFAVMSATPAVAAPRVQLELATQEGFQATEARAWYELLTGLKVNGLQIRGQQGSDKLEISATGDGDARIYRVTGLLTARNELVLPGGRFSSRDAAGISAWLEDLKTNGPPGAARPQKVFGLDEETVGRLRKQLGAKVKDQTTGRRRTEVITRIAADLKLNLPIPADAANALAEEGPLTEELQGLASGTVLSFVLRPAGYALVPRPAAGGYELRIMSVKNAQEIWPVGLPAEDRRHKVLPVLSEVIEVQIDKGTPFTQALSAIQGRVNVPFLMDLNALAAEGIDPNKVTVQLPARRLNYSIILTSLLGQARLVYELRTDEAGQPFLWITTFRRP